MESEEIKEEPITFDEEEEDIERKVFPDDEENVFKILIATDLHLGYEQTTKRLQEDDSFRTFEEILQKAKKLDVDMLLLGGDLFHESKPPSIVINRCISLLREYCLGTKDIKIKFTTDPKVVFSHCQHKTVNYEDENLNVSIPVFSIHGNHDDPSYGTIGLMDLLSSTGLVNYFGKWSDVKQVTIPPIILEKGKSKVALYGISYMNDQRLSRLIKNGKFHLLTPKKKNEDKDKEDEDQIFNIFVLHQNRARHSKNAFIPEDSLPDFLDLIVWGHEHECRIEPERVANKPYSISQPGSSVATSLAKGESEEKFVGLLKVCKGEYKLEKLKLETVRPFVFQDMILKDFEDEIVVKGKREKSEVVEEFVDHYIENVLIAEAAKQFTGDANQPQTPLIRLRIFHTEDEDIFDTLGLSQKYQDIVANPNDMIVFRKCSTSLKKLDIEEDIGDLDDIAEIFHFDDAEKDWNSTIEGGMKEFFSQENHVDKLTVLSLVGLNSALNRFVNLHDSTAIVDLTRKQIDKTVNRLMEKNIDSEEDIITEIKHYRNERLAKQKEEEEEVNNYLNIRKTQPRDNSPELMEQDNGDNESEEEFPTSTRGRGRGRAKKANATRGTAKATTRGSRARGRAARNQSILDL